MEVTAIWFPSATASNQAWGWGKGGCVRGGGVVKCACRVLEQACIAQGLCIFGACSCACSCAVRALRNRGVFSWEKTPSLCHNRKETLMQQTNILLSECTLVMCQGRWNLKKKIEKACEGLDTSFQPWRCISLSCLLCLLQLQILYSYSGLWKAGPEYTVFDMTEIWKTQRENNRLKICQLTSFCNWQKHFTSAVSQSNFTITVQRGCITFSDHVTLGKMKITLRHTKTGATVFEYDQLFSAGLLLSAVVAF